MGACLVGRSYPGKTLEQARKLWAKAREQSLHEDGHSYSGEIGMLDDGRQSGQIFNSYDDFENYLEDKSKGNAYWAQIRVIRETKPLIAAKQKSQVAYSNFQKAKREGKAPSVIRTLSARYEKARDKREQLFAAQASKSTKTTWVVGGWASS